jgi:hypothetical protein
MILHRERNISRERERERIRERIRESVFLTLSK